MPDDDPRWEIARPTLRRRVEADQSMVSDDCLCRWRWGVLLFEYNTRTTSAGAFLFSEG